MKRLFLSFAALAALVSCEQENGPVQGTEPAEGRREVTIVADAADTKTTLSDDDKVLWNSGDAVRLLFTPQDETGLPVHTEVFTTAEEGQTVTFAGTVPNGVKYGTSGDAYSDALYMVYPSTAMDDEGNVTFNLDAQQAVAPGSFPSGMNLSSSLVSFEYLYATGSVNASFLNAFAIIRFALPEDVASVKITGVAPLAGKAAFAFDTEGRLVADSWTSESNSVTMTPASATEFVAGETYNILVYPGEHSSITVELTDVDGCTYSKTVTKEFTFEAANYYTFNFNTEFGKDFSFTINGLDSVTDGKMVKAVFADDAETHAMDVEVKNCAFAGKLPHGVEATSGYAVYPASAYVDGKMKFTLNVASTEERQLAWAPMSLEQTYVTFSYVTVSDFSAISFTIPEGVTETILSSTKPLAGTAYLKVENGSLVMDSADASAHKSFTISGSGSRTFNVFPLTDASLTFTFKDAAGKTYNHPVSAVTVAAGATTTITLPTSIDFDKSGSFDHENFTDGGTTEF